ncbi:zinc transporter ZIP1-like isoform X2 [Penaeus indicus]
MWNIMTIKGIILVVMFVMTFVCSMIPVIFVKRIQHTHDSGQRSKYQTWLSLMSCSAGGVFMGTCIMDLFPDVQQQIEVLLDQSTVTSSFPVAEFIVIFGFLLVLTMEQIVLDYKETSLLRRPAEAEALLGEPNERRRNLQQQHSLSGITDQPDLTASIRSETGSLTGSTRGYGTAADSCDPLDGHGHSHLFDHSIHQDIASHSSLRSMLLLFALSLHSIFEGLAVGLQDTIDDVVALFLVVIFHKGIIAFSLGLNMVQSKLTVAQMLLGIMFFCVTAPFGVGVGMGIMELQSFTTTILSGTLQGIACGTFLYVTFFEVLPHEMNNGENRLLKLLFIILGFSAVCGVLYLDPDTQRPRCYQQPDPVPQS